MGNSPEYPQRGDTRVLSDGTVEEYVITPYITRNGVVIWHPTSVFAFWAKKEPANDDRESS